MFTFICPKTGAAMDVVSRRSVEELEAEGLRNIARLMRDQGATHYVIAKRPRGKKHSSYFQHPRDRYRFLVSV